MQTIWMINHYASREGRHAFFAEELTRRGYRVILYASSFLHNKCQETKDYQRSLFMLKESDRAGFERVWIKTPPYRTNNFRRLLNQLAFMVRVTRAGYKLNQDKPDIIVGSSVHLFACFAAYLLARRMKAPFIFEVRDLWPQTLVDLGSLKERSPFTLGLRWLEKFLYREADKVISVLPRGADYITSLGINEEKIIHIPNGIVLEWFDYNVETENMPQTLRDFFKNYSADMVFVYSGAMGLANGLDTVIEAAKIINNKSGIHFLLVGDGPEKEKLFNKVKTANITNVTFHDYVHKNEVPFILKSADACIFHLKNSLVFNYGISSNKIFEYMASGNPMIFAQESCFNMVDDAGCGISVPPDDPEALADAVIRMHEMTSEEKVALGKNGRKYVKENHEFKILTNRLIDVFEDSRKSIF